MLFKTLSQLDQLCVRYEERGKWLPVELCYKEIFSVNTNLLLIAVLFYVISLAVVVEF